MSDSIHAETSAAPEKPKRGSRTRLIVLVLLLAIALMIYVPLRITRANDHLQQALLMGEIDGVRDALNSGADPDRPMRSNAAPMDHISGLRDLLREIFHRTMRPTPHTARTPLMYAANSGRQEIVAELLRHGASVNLHLDNGYTALLYAASKYPPQVLESLIAKGADIHARTREGVTALQLAVQSGQTENVRMLLAKGADVHTTDQRGETALSLATENHREEVIQLLLAQGANEQDLKGQQPLPGGSVVRLTASGPGAATITINGRTIILPAGQPVRMPMGAPPGLPPLLFATRYGSPALLQFLWGRADAATRKQMGWAALCNMVQAGKLESIRFLLDQHVPVNPPKQPAPVSGGSIRYRPGYDPTRVYTPLHYAASQKSPEIARLLIAQGADVNAEDMFGTTPLLAAVSGGHFETVEMLIAHGANVRATERNTGQTALMRSISNVKMARLLLDRGVDVNARNRTGRTALMECYDPEVAALLLARGADVNAQDSQGNTPLFNAAHSFQTQLATLLLQHGAKVNVVNRQGETPLSTARNMRNEAVVTLLTNAGAVR